jgi:hypothetical protein
MTRSGQRNSGVGERAGSTPHPAQSEGWDAMTLDTIKSKSQLRFRAEPRAFSTRSCRSSLACSSTRRRLCGRFLPARFT